MPADVPTPVTGSVLDVLVKPGDTVSAGDEVLIVESMKMEIPIESPADGTVAEVLVAAADTVEEGQIVLRLA